MKNWYLKNGEKLSGQWGELYSDIKKHFEKLKAQGNLQRIGPAKGGYWQVTR
ncbi:MAG: hypothetical protein HQK65_11705 [Desulfamplus sp.]|nr:hypothetical protein [Desulfamplus sp.]